MINSIKYSIVLCFISFNSMIAQEIPIDGTWEIDDFLITIDVDCNCTEEQKADIAEKIISRAYVKFYDAFFGGKLIFKENDSVAVRMGENELPATSERKGENLIVHIQDAKPSKLSIITKDEQRLLYMPLGDDFLAESKGSAELENVGLVEWQFTTFTLVFSNIFDEPFDAFLDKKWEEEMLAD